MSYEFHKTNDQSLTLYNTIRKEHYHSYDGAFQEANLKYFQACQIPKYFNNSQGLFIYEIGFGLGINLIPILEHLASFKGKVHYLSTENDIELLDFVKINIDKLIPEPYQEIISHLIKHKIFENDTIRIEISMGDVRQTIKDIPNNSVDAIFHDPFSPYKNSECWTLDFFRQEHRILKDHGIWSTYSMSTPIRSGMYQAGFNVWEGVGDKTKTTGTIASKTHLELLIPLSKKMSEKLHNSPDRIPFRDPDLNYSHEKIKEVRMNKKVNEDFSDIIR